MSEQPRELAIKMTFGCPGNWIDTAAGTYIKQIDGDTSATARVSLTDVELGSLAASVERARFLNCRLRWGLRRTPTDE